MNIQGWFPLGLTGSILQSKGLSRVFGTTVLQGSAFFMVQLSHPYMTTGKTIAFDMWAFVSKVMSLLFNTLSRFVTTSLPRSTLISWLQSLSAVILEPKKIVCHCFCCFPICLPWSDGTRCHDLVFWMLSFKTASFFYLHQEAQVPLHFSALRVVSPAYQMLLIFLPAIFDSSLCFIQPSISHDVLCI